MNILAVEASGSHVGIAALDTSGEDLPQARAVLGSSDTRGLSRTLIAGLESTLERASWTLDDVEAISVGLGPGSWTSLRIGLTTCKTLAQARGWKLAGVPSFDAAATAIWRSSARSSTELNGMGGKLPSQFILVVTARCRPGEIYAKIYACQGRGFDIIQEEIVADAAAIADVALNAAATRRFETALVLTGDGLSPLSEVLSQRRQIHVAVDVPIEVLTLEVGRIGIKAVQRGRDDDPLTLQPLYVAPSAAERNLKPPSSAS